MTCVSLCFEIHNAITTSALIYILSLSTCKQEFLPPISMTAVRFVQMVGLSFEFFKNIKNVRHIGSYGRHSFISVPPVFQVHMCCFRFGIVISSRERLLWYVFMVDVWTFKEYDWSWFTSVVLYTCSLNHALLLLKGVWNPTTKDGLTCVQFCFHLYTQLCQ